MESLYILIPIAIVLVCVSLLLSFYGPLRANSLKTWSVKGLTFCLMNEKAHAPLWR